MKQRIVLFAIIAAIALLSSSIPTYAPTETYWFNTSWHFRAPLTVSNTGYARDNWPVEQEMNFSALIAQAGKNGTFDYASMRVYEHNSTGGVMHQMKYQFENTTDFNVSNNAAGTLIFLLNGTSAASEIRYFYVYFDIIENGAKSPISFATNLNYSWDGEEAHVNNSLLQWKIDTLRAENTSGIYLAGGNNEVIFISGTDSKTNEYVQYSNGTDTFSFDFRNNAANISGPVKLVLEQAGNETLWNNPAAVTGTGRMAKKYTFYDDSRWIKIEQNFTNMGASPIMRNSTRGGALSINGLSSNGLSSIFGNESNPLSGYGASRGMSGVGIINLNYSSAANYYAVYDADLDRIGITLESISLEPSESITETAVMQFDDLWYNEEEDLNPLKSQLLYPPIISAGDARFVPYSFFAGTNYTIHNRNETILIFGNTDSDPHHIISLMNATLDMGTANISDDASVALYDDGSAGHGDAAASDSIFSNYFSLSENSALGTWNITISAYDDAGVFLNQSSAAFSVAGEYNASLSIANPDGFVERAASAAITVKNKRYDTYIPGAALNCSYNNISGERIELADITDYGNGTYILNFTAPLLTGSYLLNCSVVKANNTGWDSQWFYTETRETALLLNITPENYTTENISQASGDSFIISLNTTDIGGANARSVNITLSTPSNITANNTDVICGVVNISRSCMGDYNLTVANGTAPGNYTINASAIWENPDATKNTTNSTFTVYVLPNPILNAAPANLSGTAPEGKTVTVGTFTVGSIGNDNITDITFNASGNLTCDIDGIPAPISISFNPVNISTLAAGASQSISVNVSVPQDCVPGAYNGTINASAINGGWNAIELNITVPSTAALSISRAPGNYTSGNISFSGSESFNITIAANNTGITRAKDVNITLSLPQSLSANSTIESCGNISAGSSCEKQFDITISNQTAPGNYTFNITSTWKNPDLSINSTAANITVSVLSNPILNVLENGISTMLFDNTTAYAGNFTIYSIGNDNITNTTFNVTGLSNFTFSFEPANISALDMNGSQDVSAYVSVPFAHSPGNYSGTINISSRNGGWKTLEINVSVLERREWSISPNHCERSENPETGTVCSVAVSNTGNADINFTVNSLVVNHTSANETEFTVAKNSTHSLEFLYNVSNITKELFYSYYTINATNTDASPQYSEFNITLEPRFVPLFSINMPDETEQTENIEIFVNITDRSVTGINWTKINITLPNGSIESYDMVLIGINETLSSWYFNYSGNMTTNTTLNITDENGTVINTTNATVSLLNYTGNTMARGIYNIAITARDNTGVIGDVNESFKIYAKMIIGTFPDLTKYYQSSTGSIYYGITDANGSGIENANVTLNIYDPYGNLTETMSVSTGPTGQVLPLSKTRFELTSGSKVGIYNITAATTYYDNLANKILNSVDNASFLVQSGSTGGGGGLTAEVDTAVVWYPDNVMRFEMWFSYAGNVTDPDNMTLVVNDPAGNLYLDISLNDANRTSPGLYHYKYAMPINTASGYYFAILTASKEGFVSQMVKPFRVAKGGPYDVKLTILPPLEVSRQDYLNFEVLVENMGEVTQDVYIDYWTSYDNETYFYGGEAILTPVGVNKTILRTAYIFSGQPLGINTLNVKVTYDNVQAPILLSGTFEVIDETIDIPPPPETNATTPPPSGGGGGGGDTTRERIIYLPPKESLKPSEEKIAAGSQIEIESYEKDTNIVRGWTALKSVTVKNSGSTMLTNITLSLTGIPSSWFKITPEVYESLPPGNNTVFLIEFKIPNNVDSGSYGLTFTASSKESLDEKVGRLIIFTSIEELIKQELMNLKIEIEKLEEDTDYSEKLGKNVAEARDIISSARAQIKLAEDNADKKSFDDALLNTQTASGLIKRGKRILESLGAEVPAASQKPIQSPWMFGLEALLAIIIISAIALWMIRSREKFRWASIKTYLKKSEKKADNDDKKKELANEKEKIMRMTKLLETELKEGIITQNAYNELKKRNDEKMAKIELQIKSL